MKNYVCIDVGGTSIKYGFIREDGFIIDKSSLDTEAKEKGGEGILAKIKDIVKNSYLLSMINIKYSIITLAVCLLVFAAGIMLRFVTIPIIFLFFSISFSCFICSFCACGPIERNIIK